MDALSPNANKFLQDGQVRFPQKSIICSANPLAIDKLLILTDQFGWRIDNDPLVVPEAVNMRTRFNNNGIRQGRRQFGDIVSVSWVPTRQYREPRFGRGFGKKPLVEDIQQNRNRRLHDAEVPPQLGGVQRVQPGGLVRCRQQNLTGIARTDREQPLKEPSAFRLRWCPIGACRVM